MRYIFCIGKYCPYTNWQCDTHTIRISVYVLQIHTLLKKLFDHSCMHIFVEYNVKYGNTDYKTDLYIVYPMFVKWKIFFFYFTALKGKQ